MKQNKKESRLRMSVDVSKAYEGANRVRLERHGRRSPGPGESIAEAAA